jgi:hypothetical protein
MKKSQYSESKIIAILSQQDAGSKVGDICQRSDRSTESGEFR